jgi:hypothetical protein
MSQCFPFYASILLSFFPTKIFYLFLIIQIRATCIAHLGPLTLSPYTVKYIHYDVRYGQRPNTLKSIQFSFQFSGNLMAL